MSFRIIAPATTAVRWGSQKTLTLTYVWTRPGCQLLLLNKEPGCIYV